MNARPILFSAPMIRALLDGRKTQTRRIVKPLTKRHPIMNLKEHGRDDGKYSGLFNDPSSWGFPYAEDGADMALADWVSCLCPYGKPGDLLWVRETHGFCPKLPSMKRWSHTPEESRVFYATDGISLTGPHGLWKPKMKPSIHMPRWASRLTLRITEVRVQRLQDISRGDAMDEGCTFQNMAAGPDPRQWYTDLWDSINGAGSWAANPWVWCVSFEVIKANVDTVLAQKVAA